MTKIYTVSYEGDKYTYDTRRWYSNSTYMSPPTALISVLEALLPEDLKKEIIIERHKKHLSVRKLPYQGIRESVKKGHRKTHCYLCKKKLDNLVDLECAACGWIICRCGACGCGYTAI